MELSRRDIERRDFSSVRRGYEPAEVEAHLREIAVAVEDLQARAESSQRPATLSTTASERLQVIIDAAEASAEEIRSEADEEARRTLREARREARSATEEAERRAREREDEAERYAREARAEAETASAEQIRRVEQRTEELLRRAESLDGEFEALLERMRSGAGSLIERLRGEAEALRAEIDDLPSASEGASDTGGRRSPAAEAPRQRDGAESDTMIIEPALGAEPSGDEAIVEPDRDFDPAEEEETLSEGEPDAVTPGSWEPTRSGRSGASPVEESTDFDERDEGLEPDPAASRSASTRGGGGPSSADTEGARLIALNMALSGSPRTETAEYLRQTFGLEDEALLDDVYERVQAS